MQEVLTRESQGFRNVVEMFILNLAVPLADETLTAKEVLLFCWKTEIQSPHSSRSAC